MSQFLQWMNDDNDISSDDESSLPLELEPYMYNREFCINEQVVTNDQISQVISVSFKSNRHKKKKKKKGKHKSTANKQQLKDRRIDSEILLDTRIVEEEFTDKILLMPLKREDEYEDCKLLDRVSFTPQIIQFYDMLMESDLTSRDKSGRHELKFKRSHFGAICFGFNTYIYGGVNNKGTCNDIWMFDYNLKKWVKIPVHIPAPSMINGHVYVFDGSLVCCSGSQTVTKFNGATSQSGCSSIQRILMTGSDNSTKFLPVVDFASCETVSYTYMFGGTSHGNSTNKLIELYIREDPIGTFTYMWRNAKISNPESTPSARSHARLCYIWSTDRVYLFGGITLQNYAPGSNQEPLSDLHYYDRKQDVWNKVYVEGFKPPGLYAHSLTDIQEFIYLYGGIDKNNRIQDNLYRFDTRINKWTAINIRQPCRGITLKKMMPCAHHKMTEYGNNGIPLLLIMGGIDQVDPETNKPHYQEHTISLENLLSEGVEFKLLEHVYSCMQNNRYCDLHLLCRDRRTGSEVVLTVHRSILSSRSSYFKTLLSTYDTPRGEITRIKIDNFFADTVSTYLTFLYKGQVEVSSSEEISDLLSISKDWGYYEIIHKICQGHGVYLDISQNITRSIIGSLEILLSSVKAVESSEYSVHSNLSNHYADTCVQLLSEEGETVASFVGHGVLLSVCPYFAAALGNGMMESEKKLIQLSNLSLNGFECLITYLHTEAMPRPEIPLEVLISSHMLGVDALSEYCTNLISEKLTDEDVFAALDIAHQYDLRQLKQACIQYLKEKPGLLADREKSIVALSSELQQELSSMTLEMLKQDNRRKMRQNSIEYNQEKRDYIRDHGRSKWNTYRRMRSQNQN